jgi:hypothetical protein
VKNWDGSISKKAGQILGRPLALKGFQGVFLVPFLIPSAVVFLKILKVLGSRNLLLVLHLRVLWWWFMGCMVVVYGMYGGGLWDVVRIYRTIEK